MSKNILVTGARGFVGRALCKRFSNRPGITILSLGEGDINADGALLSIKNQKIDHIYHLAALSSANESWRFSERYIRTNVEGTVRVMELSRQFECPITFVSSYVYGQPKYLPVDEFHPVDPANPYALSKLLAEQVCEFYAKHYGLNVTIVRPFNIYGAYQKNTYLIPKILNQILEGREIVIDDLRPKRDYIYIDDFIDALEQTLVMPRGCHIYNLGSGHSSSIEEIVNIFASIFNKGLNIKATGIERRNEVFDVISDNSKIKNKFQWSPKTTLCEGLTKMVYETLDQTKIPEI